MGHIFNNYWRTQAVKPVARRPFNRVFTSSTSLILLLFLCINPASATTNAKSLKDHKSNNSHISTKKSRNPKLLAANNSHISDEISIAPWVKITTIHNESNNRKYPSISNVKYDSMLTKSKNTPKRLSRLDTDMWDIVRDGFSLSGYEHSRVDKELAVFANNQRYMNRISERAAPFLYYILEEIKKRKMPTEFALLPVVESAFQPFAYSSGQAAGLWQFIPSTGRMYGLKLSWWYDGRRDVYESTKAALDFLSDLQRSYKGDWLLALAAYNSGQGTVNRARRANLKAGKPIDYWNLNLPKETRDYVPRLLAFAAIVSDPEAYGVTLKGIPNTVYFERVNVKSQIDIALAAEIADLSVEELYTMNPAFNRWATDPDGPHHLIIPVDHVDQFKRELKRLDKDDKIKWRRHKVANGESLSQIAKSYQTTVRLLKKINKIKSQKLLVGQSLIIPVATKHLSSYTYTADQRIKRIQNRNRKGKKIRHIVAKGDTFWRIAKKYQVRIAQVASWNGMSPKDTLHAGKQLIVWTQKRNSRNNNIIPTSFTDSPIDIPSTRITYKVRKGDSLSQISYRFKVSVSQLRKWNELTETKYIQPGQNLKLYVNVTRVSENI